MELMLRAASEASLEVLELAHLRVERRYNVRQSLGS